MPKNKFLTAIEEGHLQTVKTLLFNSDNNKFDMKDALITAADYGHIEIVRFLIENNTDINHINLRSETALIRAQKQKHTKVEKFLIKQCSLESNKNEINATNYNNKPSIKVNVLLIQKNINLVKYLILCIIKLFIIYVIFLILLINW